MSYRKLDAVELLFALKMLFDETVDYITINNLGDSNATHGLRYAKEALRKAGVDV